MINQLTNASVKRKKNPITSKLEEGNISLDYYDLLKWRSLHSGTIYITDEVGDGSAQDMDLEIQEAIRSGIKDMKIVISSPGGNVFSGLAIYDTLMSFRAEGGKVTTIAKGYAASMGAIILQAGTVRLATKNSKILIHEVSQFSFFEHNTSSTAVEKAKELKKVNDQLVALLADRSKLPISKIQSLIKKSDFWMTAEEAKKLNIIDKIV